MRLGLACAVGSGARYGRDGPLMLRRDFLFGAASGVLAACPVRADAPKAFRPDLSPPMANKVDYVNWMIINRGEDAARLGERFDRYQQLVGIGDLWSPADKRAFLMTPREEFVLPEDREQAYVGHYLDIGFGVTITPPGVERPVSVSPSSNASSSAALASTPAACRPRRSSPAPMPRTSRAARPTSASAPARWADRKSVV